MEKNLILQSANITDAPQNIFMDIPMDAVYRNLLVRADFNYTITGASASATANQKIRATLKATSGKRGSYGNIVSAQTKSLYTLGYLLSSSAPGYVHEVTPNLTAGTVNGYVQFPIPFDAIATDAQQMQRLNSTELTSLRLELQLPVWSDGTAVGTRSGTAKVIGAGRYEPDGISYMYPNFNELSVPAGQNNSAYQVDLKRGLPLRGILISTKGYATDPQAVINRVRLTRNQDALIDLSWQDLVAINAFAGNTPASNDAVLIDFAESGAFRDCVSNAGINDLSLYLDFNGVANSQIYIMPLEIVPANR